MSAPELMKRSDFAARHVRSKMAVSKWEKRGLLHIEGGLVDVGVSEARMRGAGIESPAFETAAAHASTAPTADAASLEDFLQRLARGEYGTKAEAEQVKENALAGLRVLEWRKAEGELVEMELAERIFFEEARADRDSWLNWPTRIGPLLAADLGLPSDKVVDRLTHFVVEHLTELGEPTAPDFSSATEA